MFDHFVGWALKVLSWSRLEKESAQRTSGNGWKNKPYILVSNNSFGDFIIIFNNGPFALITMISYVPIEVLTYDNYTNEAKR